MKTNLLILSVFLSIIIYANINYQHGISGMTLRDGGTGCNCHNEDPNDSVMVWVEGPDTVYFNDTIDYKLFMTGGPANTGGFDLAAYFGILDSVDTLTYISFGELTHSMPKQFINDTVFWDFQYVAPDSFLVDTLYATGNSTNNDIIPNSLDQWNHGENFIVNVIDEPVYIQNDKSFLNGFSLSQNYPNPFNPSTKIKFTIPSVTMSRVEGSLVTLKVYDVLGNEVATLVSKELPAGEYEAEFNGERLTSGIYFYVLKAGNFVQTKKMVIIK